MAGCGGSACSVCFDVAYQSVLPALVERGELVSANAALELSRPARRGAGRLAIGACGGRRGSA